MNTFRSLFIIVFISTLLSFTYSFPSFQDDIPNGNKVSNGKYPGVGHLAPLGGGLLNPFGTDFVNFGKKWTKELCNKDSDGDGFSNGQELGDPHCVWKKGDTPSRTSLITHPGFAEGHYPSLPVDTCVNYKPNPKDVEIKFQVSEYQIPPQNSTYMCHTFDLPKILTNTTHQIIRFDPTVNNSDVLNHMILYRCKSRPPEKDNWRCRNEMPSGCNEVVWGWNLGIGPNCLPTGVGIPIGPGLDNHFVLQVYYYNQNLTAGLVDSSGITLTISNTTNIEAGTLDLGLLEKSIKIPQQTEDYLGVGECPGFCTKNTLPKEGINVFGYFMHMHVLGKSITTYIQRASGGEPELLGSATPFDYNFQTWVALSPPVKIYPGDSLITKCNWNNSESLTPIRGGHSINKEEMCKPYIAYYPRIPTFTMCANFTDSSDRLVSRCGDSELDWITHQVLPICKVSDIPAQASFINTMVLPNCTDNNQCSEQCRTAVLDWINNTTTTCVKRHGLNFTLSHCGVNQDSCSVYKYLFEQRCLGLCDYDDPIWAFFQCYANSTKTTCNQNYQCSLPPAPAPFHEIAPITPTNKVTLAIASVVTASAIIILILIGAFIVLKCRRVRKRIEYVS